VCDRMSGVEDDFRRRILTRECATKVGLVCIVFFKNNLFIIVNVVRKRMVLFYILLASEII